MKTMNYILLICLFAFGISCSEPELTIDEPSATDLRFSFEQQPKYLNGLELYKQGAIANHLKLKQEISKLKEAIQGGQRNLLPKLEAAQEKESELIDYKGGLTMLKAPTGGKFPPRPPRGCWEDPRAGCDPKLNISGFSGIQVTEGLDEADIVIRDEKNRIVGKGENVSRLRGGAKVIPLDANFRGDATMYITPKSKLGRNGVVLEIPVTIN